MKTITHINRLIVGLLFIFSGLVKAIDPLGLSYKMNEFFAKWEWNFAPKYSLAISIVMIAFEIFAGIALLLGWHSKHITRLLLLLIVFFTILTGYAYLSGKFHSCGCFGDCIPITSGTSFTKDLVLLLLIVQLCFAYKKITPLFSKKMGAALLITSIISFFYLMFHVLNHLPIIDCLPYAKGKKLLQQMQAPPGSIPDSTVINFVYKKDGKEIRFDANHFPEDFNDSSYQFVDRETIVVRKGNATPAIADLVFKNEMGEDATKQLLQTNGKYLLFFAREDSTINPAWSHSFNEIAALSAQKKLPLFVVTNMERFSKKNAVSPTNISILVCDGTVMKTFLRSPTGMVLMDGDLVVAKYNISDADKLIKALP